MVDVKVSYIMLLDIIFQYRLQTLELSLYALLYAL